MLVYVKDSATFLWTARGECIVASRRPHLLPDSVDRDDRPAGCVVHKAGDYWPEDTDFEQSKERLDYLS